jgi:hypothetical protein
VTPIAPCRRLFGECPVEMLFRKSQKSGFDLGKYSIIYVKELASRPCSQSFNAPVRMAAAQSSLASRSAASGAPEVQISLCIQVWLSLSLDRRPRTQSWDWEIVRTLSLRRTRPSSAWRGSSSSPGITWSFRAVHVTSLSPAGQSHHCVGMHVYRLIYSYWSGSVYYRDILHYKANFNLKYVTVYLAVLRGKTFKRSTSKAEPARSIVFGTVVVSPSSCIRSSQVTGRFLNPA